MTVHPNGVATTGKSHHALWCRDEGLIHDSWMVEQICRHIKMDDIVVEGGAHIGTLTKAMLNAGAFVFAFEPNADAAKCLSHNCRGGRLTVATVALGEGIKKCQIVRDEDNAGKSWCLDTEGETLCDSLDSEILSKVHVSLVKLDIEGWELKALRGGVKLLARCRPILIVEVNDEMLRRAGDSREELLEFIDGHGYTREILQPDCKWDDPQYDIRCIAK